MVLYRCTYPLCTPNVRTFFGMEDTYGSSYVPLFSIEWILLYNIATIPLLIEDLLLLLFEKVFDNKYSLVFVLLLDEESITNC